MLKVDRIRTSTKAIGKYEEALINRVSDHFRKQGYKVFPHARFNIAWGSNLSDLDILLVKGDTLTVVEVKSKRDKMSRAGQQIHNISDYIDYSYVATDRLPKSWSDSMIGLLLIGETIETVKKAKRFTGRPTVESLFALQKKCLLCFLGEKSSSHLLKYEIAETVRSMGSEKAIHRCLKKIVICEECCKTSCPILRFAVKNGLNPLPSSFSGSLF